MEIIERGQEWPKNVSCSNCGTRISVNQSDCKSRTNHYTDEKLVTTYVRCPVCKGNIDIDSEWVQNACFISTACVVAKNLPDDCDELQTLRKWRDQFSKDSSEFKLLKDEYYKFAPIIVKKIDEDENKVGIYNCLYKELVLRTVNLLAQGKHKRAIENYKKHYFELKNKYI